MIGGEKSFGALLRELRAAAGLSQEELAERAGLSRRGISDLERGSRRSPHPTTLRRLADGLRLGAAQHSALLAAARQHGLAGGGALEALPTPLSTFVGRSRELIEVGRLLETTRFLTLTGAGGVGKTRLAIAVVTTLEPARSEAGESMAFVDLAPLITPDLLPHSVAAQLGVPEQPARPILTTLIDALRSKRCLLVLDNCEHLRDACAVLAHELLVSCPGVRILATSREPLRVAGEHIWRVPSLEVPSPAFNFDQIADSGAVRLFIERARAVQAGFDLNEENAGAVAEVCRRLGGIPLALELAAARVSMLAVQQIAERLDDVLGLLVSGSRLAPARQQTVRATLDWSYGLLSRPEQLLFERLSAFAGGWTLEAAEAVAQGDGLASNDVLALLGRLVDTCMVLVERGPATGHVRYRLLEAVRQYGAERLHERGSTYAIHRQHAAYFLRVAEQTEPEFSSPRVMAAQTRLEMEHDNLRTSLGWLLDQQDVESAQRLAGALGRFWFFRGHVQEAEASLKRALALSGSDRPTLGRAKCMFALSVLAMSRGDYAAVEPLASESRALFQALGNGGQEAFCLFHLGQAATRLGKYSEAAAYFREGLAISRAARHGGAESNCLFSLAELASDLGEDDEARVWAEAALKRATEIDQERQIAVARRVLGVLATRSGDYSGAAGLFAASLATWRALGARWWIAETLVPFAQLAIRQGEIQLARSRLSESLKLAQELGDLLRVAATLEGFVQVCELEGRPGVALQLVAAAESIRASIGVPLPPAERSVSAHYVSRARTVLGARAAEAAQAAGRVMAMQQAIELALEGATVSGLQDRASRKSNGLTAREQEVACLVVQGLTNRQIAERLVIAEGTAERHVGNILAKLEMNARSQIAAWAVRQGLVASEIPARM